MTTRSGKHFLPRVPFERNFLKFVGKCTDGIRLSAQWGAVLSLPQLPSVLASTVELGMKATPRSVVLEL